MFKVFIIGAGQIGSRHLQALKKVGAPLDITVVDPSTQALVVAKNRYEEIKAPQNAHKIIFLSEIPKNQKVDLAIVASTSNVRATIIKNLLKNNRVKYFILEKLLFDKKKDYEIIEKLFFKLKIKAWVNCPLRLRPLYQKIRKETAGSAHFSFRLTGHRWGLATNTVHCLDFISSVLGSTTFEVNTDFLDKKIIPSKRKGFLELNGTLSAHFGNKAHCELTSEISGEAPRLVEVFSDKARYIFPDQEKDGEALVSRAENNWKWERVAFHTPLVSETTAWVVEDIIKKGDCGLTTFRESAKIHLTFLEPLRQFLNKNSKKKYDYYPFT